VSDFAALPAEARELALGRYRLLAPYLKVERTLRSVADESGLPFPHSTARFERYRRFGIAALARKGRTDDGGRWIVSSRVIKAIEGLALERPPLVVASIYRQSNSSPLPSESRSQVIGGPSDRPQAAPGPSNTRAQSIQQKLRFGSPSRGGGEAERDLAGRSCSARPIPAGEDGSTRGRG